MTFLNQLFTILTGAEGTLFFHLILTFAALATLPGAQAHYRATNYVQWQRTVLGLGLLVGVQAVLFVVGALLLNGLADPRLILPSLDRAAMAFSLVIAVWLWAYPEPMRAGEATTVLLSLLILVGLVFDVLMRSQADPASSYNLSFDSLAWSIFSILYAILGAIVLIGRRPSGWEYGLVFLAFALIGHGLDAAFPDLGSGGNYSGVLRLAYVAAFQFLPTLTQRFGASGPAMATTQPKKVVKTAKAGEEKEGERPFRERRRYSTDAKTLSALLTLAAEIDAKKISDDLTRAIAQTMLADLCFLIYPDPDKRHLNIASGFDLIREEHLVEDHIDKDIAPMLAAAIFKGKPLNLPASTTSADLKGLGDRLGLSQGAGNLLSVPIAMSTDKGAAAPSLLLLSPYSHRQWTTDDQSFLINNTVSFIPVLERGQRMDKLAKAKERAERDIQDALARAAQAENEMRGAKDEVAQIRAATQDSRLNAEKLTEALRELDDLRSQLVTLEKENHELSQAFATASPGNNHLEGELRQTLKEMARLQNQLAAAEMKLIEFEQRPSGVVGIPSDQAEVIASLSQELRQPMSSIVGYADLLLGESVGILGALQRKFIERIKASTERIGSLIDDLIQITTLETGLKKLRAEAVDLNLIIDNAMAYTSSQLREKNIALRIDIAKSLQPILVDREAMQHIMIHLLQNAGAATPVEGTISLRVRTQKEADQEHVLIQVSDTGGGIPEADLPRVFSRLYRAENVLIQGVGDTGVGLSIAKALTEAQGGRIWVETEMSVGSTFNVQLPIQPAQEG